MAVRTARTLLDVRTLLPHSSVLSRPRARVALPSTLTTSTWATLLESARNEGHLLDVHMSEAAAVINAQVYGPVPASGPHAIREPPSEGLLTLLLKYAAAQDAAMADLDRCGAFEPF